MTPSDDNTRSWPASFSDGQSAKGWPSRVHLDYRGVIIDRGDGEDELVWPYGALKTDTPVSPGAGEALVTYDHMPGARLFVQDQDFVRELRSRAKQLTTASHRWRWAKPFVAVAVLAVAVVAVIWMLELRPARTIAAALPESSRTKVGRNVIDYFKSQHKVCIAPEGRAALDKLMIRLLQTADKPDYYKVTVVDWGLVNAFAAPGGQMLLTKGLIRAAQSPEEVAGVLAHEIGHGVELHPETGLVRAVGLSALVELLTGGSSGALSNLSAMFLQNSYVRKDERAADVQALKLLKSAGIAKDGLADFFKRIGAGKNTGKTLSRKSFGAFDLLRTHPFPAERAKMVREAADYPATPALSANDWNALRRICSRTEKKE